MNGNRKLSRAGHIAFAIVGNGRVGGAVAGWRRAAGDEIDILGRADFRDAGRAAARIGRADILAVAVPDGAIAEAIRASAPHFRGRAIVHFSGAHVHDGAFSYHPLCSFPKTPLPPDDMARVAFAVEEGAPPLGDIFPGAENPAFVVAAKDRAFYHALAVLSGNFAAHLWNETARVFTHEFGPEGAAALAPYFESVVARFSETPFDSMTGPVARRDAGTVLANLAALERTPALRHLYEAFLRSAWKDASMSGEFDLAGPVDEERRKNE